MATTVVDPNNARIRFKGKAEKERPVATDDKRTSKLRRRGLISDKAHKRLKGEKA